MRHQGHRSGRRYDGEERVRVRALSCRCAVVRLFTHELQQGGGGGEEDHGAAGGRSDLCGGGT